MAGMLSQSEIDALLDTLSTGGSNSDELQNDEEKQNDKLVLN